MNPAGQILIVNEQSENANLLINKLNSQEYNISHKESSEEALNYLNQYPNTDIVILEISSSEKLNPFQLCQDIKSNDNLSDIPVLFITNNDNQGEIEKCFQAGATDYLNLQSLTQLLPRISYILNAHQDHVKYLKAQAIVKKLSSDLTITAEKNTQELQEIKYQFDELNKTYQELIHTLETNTLPTFDKLIDMSLDNSDSTENIQKGIDLLAQDSKNKIKQHLMQAQLQNKSLDGDDEAILLDTDKILLDLGSKEELLKKVLEQFRKDTKQRLETCSLHIENKDYEALSTLIHTLKGSSRLIYTLLHFSKTCLKVEGAIKSQKEELCLSLLEHLYFLWENIYKEINHFLEPDSSVDIKPKHRILIVDDDKSSLLKLESILKKYGQVTAFTESVLALDNIKSNFDKNTPYDLIITDQLMPDLSGNQLSQAIREMEELNRIEEDKRTKIMMVTQIDNFSQIIESINMGVEVYISKPYNDQNIIESLENQIFKD